jgi:acyl-CoA thioesterase FadM
MDNASTTFMTPSGRIVHEASFTVPFHLSDPVGVLFFGNIYAAVHYLLEEWAQRNGIWQAWFGGASGTAYPIRHSEADYLRFMKTGDTFAATIRVASLSDSTVKFETEFAKGGFVHARVLTAHTAIDLSTQSKSTIEPKLRRFFQ